LAVERSDRGVIAKIGREVSAGDPPVTHGGVVGQVWRGGRGRQAQVARILRGVEVQPLDEQLGRLAGWLCGRSATVDVIDAALISLAVDGDEILTSDAGDLRRLAEAADLHVDIIPV
jgi:hypothetical protein